MGIDKIALAVAVVALIREHVPALTGKWTTLVSLVACVAVYFCAPYLPVDLYNLILAVVGPMGGYAAGKQLLSKASTVITPPTGTP